jgi:lipopolysaccharide/colanic/teichoic acid biosynthesis glycosyltransferase
MIKRFCDIAVSVLFLLLFWPLFVVVGVLIIIETRGPVFFRQIRIGKKGTPFSMFKFRKFPHHTTGGPGITLADDCRLTRVGKFLERFKLDELPQFLNVVKGEMSIVGPRPETPQFVRYYNDEDFAVLDVRPGIFGINQLIYRREADLYPEGEDPEAYYINEIMPRKLANDISYIHRASVYRDVIILLRCLWSVVYEPLTSCLGGSPKPTDPLNPADKASQPTIASDTASNYSYVMVRDNS